MDTKKIIADLKKLIQTDIDAVYVYTRALEQISDDIIQSQLTGFRDNHMEHINVLTDKIQSLGGVPPKFSKDLKGLYLETVAALFTAAGMKGAMIALKKMEEQTNEIYGLAISLEFSSALKEIIRTHFSDEKTHLDYISENLKVL